VVRRVAWADPGGPDPPIFGKVNFISLHCIQCSSSTLYTMSEQIFLKVNLDFIVAEIRGVFGNVGDVCVCV